MQDLAVIAGLIMATVVAAGVFAVASVWLNAPRWIGIAVSIVAISLGMWWWTIPTGARTLGLVVCAIGLWTLATAIARDDAWKNQ